MKKVLIIITCIALICSLFETIAFADQVIFTGL